MTPAEVAAWVRYDLANRRARQAYTEDSVPCSRCGQRRNFHDLGAIPGQPGHHRYRPSITHPGKEPNP